MSALDRLREIGQEGEDPGVLFDLGEVVRGTYPVSVVAIDQSFSATGVVVLETEHEGRVRVVSAHTLRADPENPELRGTPAMLERAWTLTPLVRSVIPGWVNHVVMEEPPVGPKLRNAEVSLLAGLAVMHAAVPHRVRMVHSNRWKKVMGGYGKGKRSSHDNLPRVGGLYGLEKVTNESQRDALCIGIAFIHDLYSGKVIK